jgi:hypothetical protein
MIKPEIDLINLTTVQHELNQLFAQLDADELGRVYHEGAYGPSGQRYEALVQKEGEQAAVHQGYWHTDQDVVDQRQADVRDIFAELVSSIATGRRVNVRQATAEALQLIYNDLRQYPPPRAGSDYIRTGELGSGWRWAVT